MHLFNKLAIVLALAAPMMAAAEQRLVISLEEQRLYLLEEQKVIAQFPVGIGKPSSPTPVGSFRITTITKNPTWTVPESIMKGPTPPAAKKIPPGPDNPLGVYFIRLDDTSYGIHGTTAPKLVPGEVSAGCIRMTNKDVSLLAELVSRGNRVDIIAGAFQEDKPSAEEVDARIKETVESKIQASGFLKALEMSGLGP